MKDYKFGQLMEEREGAIKDELNRVGSGVWVTIRGLGRIMDLGSRYTALYEIVYSMERRYKDLEVRKIVTLDGKKLMAIRIKPDTKDESEVDSDEVTKTLEEVGAEEEIKDAREVGPLNEKLLVAVKEISFHYWKKGYEAGFEKGKARKEEEFKGVLGGLKKLIGG